VTTALNPIYPIRFTALLNAENKPLGRRSLLGITTHVELGVRGKKDLARAVRSSCRYITTEIYARTAWLTLEMSRAH
jgi:hypothetical protein